MKLRNKKTGAIYDVFLREREVGGYPCIIVCDKKAYMQSKTKFGVTNYVLDEYSSLAELNEDWEDYEPVEPLVEGMSQRAVLRAAARLSSTNAATVQRSDIAEIVIFDFGGQCRVELKDRGINVKNRGVYSIEELCGEEEE